MNGKTAMNVYDFDGTIYRGDSTVDFYRFALRRDPTLIRFLPGQLFGFVSYALGRCDKVACKERFFRFLRGLRHPEETVAAFWLTHRDNLAPWYLAQKRSSDLIISASPDFLLRPLCEELGVRLIASDVDIRTGSFSGENCKGAEKVKRLRQCCPDAVVEDFYSDSVSDLPLAELAQNAYLVRKNSVEPWEFSSGVSLSPRSQMIRYLIFGILTTAINEAVYYVCFHPLHRSNLFSTAVAWFAAVLFAFITNKLWVFGSKSFSKSVFLRECLSFFSCRIATGILDMAIMYVSVDCYGQNELLWKLLSNGVVIVLNYVASKLLIFKKQKS